MKIILASGSPRRKEILKEAGFEYEVHTTDCAEDTEETYPDAYVEELSSRKAYAVANEIMESKFIPSGDADEVLIIGADTVVALEDSILGKPASKEEAVSMITSLSGKSHSVFTGVTMILLAKGEKNYHIEIMETFSEETQVYVKAMTEAEIHAYVEKGESMDKAGAYGIQGAFREYIDHIEGSFNNVVGFPIETFCERVSIYMEEEA